MDIRLNWLARHGTFIICSLLVILASLSWLIKYPEIVTTNARLSGANAPKPILVYQTGKLDHLILHNGADVSNGDIIGCLETTADWREVIRLSSLIDTIYREIKNDEYDALELMMSQSFGHLGELQPDYELFANAYIPFRNYVLGGYAKRKATLLQRDIAYIDQAKSTINQQSDLYKQDLALNQKSLENNEVLLKENVISEQEYRELTSQNINKRLTMPQIQSSYISVDAQRNDKQKELLELENSISTQKAVFKEAIYSIRSKIDSWKRNYLLIAPISGRLSFTSFIQENQTVEAGQLLAYIDPMAHDYYLQVVVPQNNFGKVSVGQRVILKFNAWQWQEYGTVTGKIEYLSSIASDSGYIAKVVLPQGLKTNRGKAIVYKEGLTAQAEIITHDMRLTERFYYDVIRQLNND